MKCFQPACDYFVKFCFHYPTSHLYGYFMIKVDEKVGEPDVIFNF